MRKFYYLFLSIAIVLCLCSCGGEGNSAVKLALEEMASTDLVDFTLEKAEFTYYVENTIDDTYYLPTEDKDTIYAASLGNCLVALTFTMENKDRAGNISVCDISSEGWNPEFEVTYNKEKYELKGFDLNKNDGDRFDLTHSAEVNLETGEMLETHGASNYLLDAGETVTLRTFGIINTEPENLTDGFDFSVKIPTVDGKYQKFTYTVPAK